MDWPTIAVRFALYATLTALFGLSAFSLYGLTAKERVSAIPLTPWLIVSAALAVLLSLCSIDLMAAGMAGVPAWPVDRASISALLDGSSIGRAWKIRMIALLLAGVAAMLGKGRAPWLALVVLASGAALGTLAWTGHGAMDDGGVGRLHLAADILHLAAAGLWAGALLGLILLVTRSADKLDPAHLGLTYRALHGFGAVGTILVGAIVVTGLINAWLLVGIGHVATLDTTLYGRLLIAKLALFAVMLGLASLNRFRLTPIFQRSIASNDPRRALSTLRRSLAVETTCIVAILGLVAWLGTLEPPISAMG